MLEYAGGGSSLMCKRPISWFIGCSAGMLGGTLFGGGEKCCPGACGSGPCGGELDGPTVSMP
jgi:hypothetical protein